MFRNNSGLAVFINTVYVNLIRTLNDIARAPLSFYIKSWAYKVYEALVAGGCSYLFSISMAPFLLDTKLPLRYSSRFQICFDFQMHNGSFYCPFKLGNSDEKHATSTHQKMAANMESLSSCCCKNESKTGFLTVTL